MSTFTTQHYGRTGEGLVHLPPLPPSHEFRDMIINALVLAVPVALFLGACWLFIKYA